MTQVAGENYFQRLKRQPDGERHSPSGCRFNLALMISALLDEVERNRVHAIAQAGRSRTVIEDMTEMRVATTAHHFGARRAETAVNFLGHIRGGNGLVKTGPARPRFKLRFGIEQREIAVRASV